MRLNGVFIAVGFTALIQGGMSLSTIYLSSRGYSPEQIILPITLMGVGGLIGSLVGGLLTDYFSHRLLAVLVSIFWLFAPIGFTSKSHILVSDSFLFAGLSLSILRSIYLASITHTYLSKEMELKLSYRRLILNLGFAVGGWLAGLFLHLGNINFIYYLMVAGISTLGSSYLIPSSKIRVDKEKKQVRVDKNPNASPICYTLLLCALLFSLFAISLISNFYTLYMKEEIKVTQIAIGNMFAISGFMIVLLQVPINQALKKTDKKLQSILGVFLITVGIGGSKWINSEFGLYISSIVWTLGEIVLFVPILKELLDVTPLSNGKTISSYQFVFSVSDVITPLVSGFIISISYSFLWDFVFFLGGISILILTIMHIRDKF